MKAAHIKKIQARLDRVTAGLLPDGPNKIKNLAYFLTKAGPSRGITSAVKAADIQRLLEVEVPELIQEVHSMKAELMKLRRDSWYLSLENEAAAAAEVPPDMQKEVA